ncbi:DUF3347 domain-containing protein [Flavobacterium algicola]|uniref:DUF3347 domain-containing protein n=1 Tax=Flavobacterium algicola TaxID=556529 RepID=UPI001EFDCB90|nr:DUF3347 domain-containing protein [Flavobacterium algicola]MCG9791470.1 DUF3347 domain-containing protein [Flavobacterium algicola]
MKNLIKIGLLSLVLILASCKDNKENASDDNKEMIADNELYFCSMHPEITGKMNDICSECGMKLTEKVSDRDETVSVKKMEIIKSKAAFSTDLILDKYINLKNKLAADDSKAAAAAGTELERAIEDARFEIIEAELQNQYTTITKAAIEETVAITANSEKIANQRKQFAALSQNMTYLIQMFDTDKILYQDYCPMYGEGKNGYWISEVKDIKNPYYGAEMLTCGGLIKEL